MVFLLYEIYWCDQFYSIMWYGSHRIKVYVNIKRVCQQCVCSLFRDIYKECKLCRGVNRTRATNRSRLSTLEVSARQQHHCVNTALTRRATPLRQHSVYEEATPLRQYSVDVNTSTLTVSKYIPSISQE